MDEATLTAAKNGNRAARDTLVRGLQDVWYRFCLSLLRDPNLAVDAAQETAFRFLRDLQKFDGRSSIKTWSIGISVNVVREMRRKRRPGSLEDDSQIESEDDSDSPLRLAQGAEEQAKVRELLASLPDRQRETIVLRFFEAMSVDETAAAMNVAPGTIKATVHQALRSLRKRWEDRAEGRAERAE